MNKNHSNFKTMKINYLNFNSMKTTKFFIKALFCLTLITSFTSCSDDDSDEVLEDELITNVTLRFVNDADGTDIVEMTSVAPDGQEGASSEIVTGSFTSGATYSLNLSITNNTEMPADDVLNDDIIPEADEHFFAYAVTGLNLTLTRDTNDTAGPDGSKLGVNTTWVAGAASMGNVQIRLIHEPDSVDDSNEFGTASGGSEDFNISFTGVSIL